MGIVDGLWAHFYINGTNQQQNEGREQLIIYGNTLQPLYFLKGSLTSHTSTGEAPSIRQMVTWGRASTFSPGASSWMVLSST